MLRRWIITALAMLPLDAVWLTLMADPLYRARLGGLLLPAFAPLPAVLFYLLYVTGIVLLVPRAGAAWRGGLLGLVAYGTYDLTNQATLAGWSWAVTGADLVWGTLLTGTAAWVGVRFSRA